MGLGTFDWSGDRQTLRKLRDIYVQCSREALLGEHGSGRSETAAPPRGQGWGGKCPGAGGQGDASLGSWEEAWWLWQPESAR